MTKKFAILFAIATVVVCGNAENLQIGHLIDSDSQLIYTSANNYAISGKDLLFEHNWKTVSVNGISIVVYQPDCRIVLLTTASLTDLQQESLEKVRAQLEGARLAGQNNLPIDGSASYTYHGDTISSPVNLNINDLKTQTLNGYSVHKTNQSGFSVSRDDLPNNLARVFVNSDMVTFVYRDGQVFMKPMACLERDERDIVNPIERTVYSTDQQHPNVAMIERNSYPGQSRNVPELQLILQKIDHLPSSFSTLASKTDDRSRELGQKLDMMLYSLRQNIESNMNVAHQRTTLSTETLNQKIDLSIRRFSEKSHELSAKLETIKQWLSERIDEKSRMLDHRLASVSGNFDSKMNMAHQKTDLSTGTLSQKLEMSTQKFNEKSQELNTKLDMIRHSLAERVDEKSQALGMKLQEINSALSHKVETSIQKLDQNTKDTGVKLETVSQKLNDKIESKSKEIEGKLEASVRALSETSQILNNRLEQKLSALEEKMDTMLVRVLQNFEQKTAEISSLIDSRANNMDQKLTHALSKPTTIYNG